VAGACAAAVLVVAGPPLLGARPIAERVEIRRDTYGVPHIRAEDEEAAGFGFGYAMAEDHAEALGRRYIAARGDAARVFGGAADVETDLAMRRLDNRGAARRALAEDTGRRFRRYLQGFAAGVNRYTETHRDAVPAWMPVVEASDPIAFGRMFGVLGAVRPPQQLLEKYPSAGSAAHDDTLAPRNPAYLRRFPDVRGAGSASVVIHRERTRQSEEGSNAFALAGSKTTSGRPMLLGNPHLAWGQLYWEAHVTVPGRINFYGSTLVGIPVLRAGFNDRLAYVQTNNAPDLADIYALPAGETDITRRRVAIAVKDASDALRTVEQEFEETRLGPVVHRTAGQVFVVRSISVEWLRQYEGFFELQQAGSLREFRNVLDRRLLVTSNYTYADVDGNIFYAWNARLPRRGDDAVDYSLDVPALDRRLFWKGIHRLADLPSLLNPPGGYVQNANNPPWYPSVRDQIDRSRYPAYIERGDDLSLRAQFVLDELEGTPKFSVEAARRLKFTTRMLLADRTLTDLILAAGRAGAAMSEPLRAGIETLSTWDRSTSAGSVGAILFERFWTLYEAQLAEPFAVPWTETEPMTTPRGLADVDVALAALERAVTEIRGQYGSERVTWGAVHRYRFGDLELPGDGAAGRYGVYRVVGFDPAPNLRRVAGNMGPAQPLAGFGDAWVLLVHFTRPVTAWSVLAYGQTANLQSPHSRDQIWLFANHQLRQVWFTEADIAAHLERRYHPGS
jgi:acyl-homoserine-lactone acylase